MFWIIPENNNGTSIISKIMNKHGILDDIIPK